MKKYTIASTILSAVLFIIGFFLLNQPISNFDKKFESVRVKLKKSQIVFYDVMELPETSPEISKLVQVAKRGEYNLREVMNEIDKAKKLSLKPPVFIPALFFLAAILLLAITAWFISSKIDEKDLENQEIKNKFNQMNENLLVIKEELDTEKEKTEEEIEAFKEQVITKEIDKINQGTLDENISHINEVTQFEANRPSLIPSVHNTNYIDWLCQNKKIDLDRSMQLGEKFNHIIPKEIPHKFYLGVIQDLQIEEDSARIKLAEDRDNRTFLYQVRINSKEEIQYNLEGVAKTYKYLEEVSNEYFYSVDIQHNVTQKDIDFNLKITVPTKA